MSDPTVPQIISHYQVDSLLGVGAMGSVYLGIDRRDGTLVAIKLIAEFLAKDSEFRSRFEREAHVAALLRSPYAVRILDYGVEAGRVFIAMEYVDGPTVREVLESGPLDPARATRIALQVARALEEAEARGIVHRDVKPDNILLGPEDTAKLADFGVARQQTSRLTQTGGFYGTAAYAAPEQFAGHADNRSDIYALGASLYHMLLGRPPVGGDLEQARRQVLSGAIAFDALAEWPQLQEIAERAMKPDPSERYQSAQQLAGALETALAGMGGAGQSALATVVGTSGMEGDWRAEEENLRLALKGPKTSLPFGRRYAALRYELDVTNHGHTEADLRLRAADRANACRFSLGERLSVPAGATSHVAFKVRPEHRRFRGPDLTRIFTVSAISTRDGGGDDGDGHDDAGDAGDPVSNGGAGGSGGPPTTVAGRFNDSSFGWLPLGVSGLALIVAFVALLVAVVATGASSNDTAAAVSTSGTSTATLSATPSPRIIATRSPTRSTSPTPTRSPSPTPTRIPSSTPSPSAMPASAVPTPSPRVELFTASPTPPPTDGAFSTFAFLDGHAVGPGKSVGYSIDFGHSFNSVTEVRWDFNFSGDLLDEHDCILIFWYVGPAARGGGGFCSSSEGGRTGTMLETAQYQPEVVRFLDGVETGYFDFGNWDVEQPGAVYIESVVVTVFP